MSKQKITKKDEILKKRLLHLVSEMESKFPKLKEAIDSNENDAIVFHQDTFAPDLNTIDFIAIGMVIKYIGLSGKTVQIVGKNRETIDN